MAFVENSIYEAAEMFQSDFDFYKMNMKIHRFPAGLRSAITSSGSYIVPRLVAVGPYHHGKGHLENMEKVKEAAAYYFCQIWNLVSNEAYKKVFSIVSEARGKYVTDETIFEGMKDDAYFAAMMFRDACFLLLYMDAYNRSRAKDEDWVVNLSMRRFLFSNRDSIDNDIMLLENQLPWQVVQVLIDSVEAKENLAMVVGKFIADMGNTFKIYEDLNPKTYVWWDDEENPPPHLLALLRRHKTELEKSSDSDDGRRCLPLLRTPSTPQNEKPKVSSTSVTSPMKIGIKLKANKTNSDDGRRCLPLLRTPSTPRKEKPKVSSISVTSPMEIGIKLTANKTDAFSDMAFVEGHLSLSEISVAPLSLSDARASCLVNMAAFEVCTVSRFGDDANKTAVCSYLALLALFF